MPAVLRLSVAAAPLLEDAVESFLLESRLRGLSATYLVLQRYTLGPFAKYARSVGCDRIDEVTEAHVRAFVADRQSRVQAARVNQYRMILRCFFDWAQGEGFVAVSPAARLRKLREPRKIIATLGLADLEALLRQPDTTTFVGLRDLTFILLLLDTGLRLSEALGLRLGDVDLPGLTLRVMGKGARERLVGFSPTCAARLQTYLTRRALALKSAGLPDHGWVWLNWFGKRATAATFHEQLKRYGRRAGLNHVRVSAHTMRHSFAVFFVRNGGSPFHLQRCLGHSSLLMSRHYCELADVDFLTKQRELSLVSALALDSEKRPRLRHSAATAEPGSRPAATTSASRPSRPAPPASRNGSSSRGSSVRGCA